MHSTDYPKPIGCIKPGVIAHDASVLTAYANIVTYKTTIEVYGTSFATPVVLSLSGNILKKREDSPARGQIVLLIQVVCW